MNSSLKEMSFHSPNASKINHPLAESTAIRSSVLQQQEMSFRGNQTRKTVLPLSNASKQRLSSVQIEPHVLTNAQSRGIVKRLVTYYDESQGDVDKNKYVYNRVGDFPIVQLKKTELKRNLVRSSSVRIAPPSKTVFNRDIRAAIIRSNSMQMGASVPKLQPTKMRARDDAHQIITNHEPLPIDEITQSAKSVLDALEKNCRKRINNEELTMDRTKRACVTEAVDGPSNREFVPIAPQSAKRGRDQTSPNQNSESPNSQLRKKLRTRNNALFSSLSSSNFGQIRYNSAPPPPSASAPTKIVKFTDGNDDVERTEKRLRQATVSVVEAEKPKAPQEKRLYLFNAKTENTRTFRSKATSDDDDEEFKVNFVKPRAKPINYEDSDELQPFKKNKLSIMLSGLSDGFKSPVREEAKDSVDAPKIPATTPASISFTTSTITSTSAPITTPVPSTLSLSGTSSLSKNSLIPPVKTSEPTAVPPSTESSKPTIGIQFGISKTSIPSTSTTTPAATTTSSLVSPLSSFSNLSSDKPASIDPNKSLISFTPVAKPAVSSNVPSLVSTSSSVAPAVITFGAPTASAPISFGSSNKETPKTTSSFSFGSSISTMSGFNNENVVTSTPVLPVASTVTTTAPPSFNFQAQSTAPFSFGAKPTVSVAPVVSSGTSGISALGSDSGNPTSTVAFMQKPETTTASGIGFSFSGNAVQAAPTTTASSGGFSFGSLQNSSGIAAPVTTASSFSFGASSNSAFAGSTATATFGQPQTSAPTFGQTSSTTPSFGQAAATTTAPGFSGFGQVAPAQPTAGGMFSFGQKTASPQVTSTTTSSFSFGGSAAAATSPSSGFSFGQSNSIQPATTTASSGIFGRLGDKPQEAKPAFSFGGNNQQPASTPSMFGGISSSTSAPSAPMFGSTMGNSAFGQPSNNQPAASSNMFGNSTPANDFGSISKPTSSGMFSFGGASNGLNNNNQAAAASSPSGGIFNFNNNTPSHTQATSNVFGGGSSGQNVSASFTFKPSTGTVSSNTAPSVFGQSQPSPAPPSYQFGGQTTANASFTFGGASTTSQNPAQSAFNFNGPQSAPASGGFNFQSAQPSLAPQPTAGGLFNIGTGGNNQQQRRPIRQAMRRMK